MFRYPIVVILVAALVGCSVLNPHISIPRQPELPSDTLAGGLDAAIREAESLNDAYYEAVGTQSIVRNGTALTLIPLSAAALGIGITSQNSATRNVLTGMGLGGAALYASASYATDVARQLVWLKGSEALTCAVKSMRPLAKPKAELPALDTEIFTLSTALAHAQSVLSPPTTAESAALNRAQEILTAARRLRELVATSGEILHSRVWAIRDAVSEQVLRTEPDLNAVLAAAGGLRTVAGQIAPGAIPAPTSPKASGFAGAAPLRLNWRDAEIANLSLAAAPLADVLNQVVAAERAVGDPDPCLPADTAGAPRLVVPTDVITIAPGQSTDLPIAAAGIPRIAIQGADHITTNLEANGGFFTLHITAASDAAPGDRSLIIADQGGRETARITVRIGGGGPPISIRGGGPSGARGGGKPAVLHSTKQDCESTPGDLSKHGLADCGDFELIAKLVNVKDAKTPSDPAFESAIKAKKTSAGDLPANAKVTPTLRRALGNATPLPPSAPAPPSPNPLARPEATPAPAPAPGSSSPPLPETAPAPPLH
jgi:hypothetical protein